MYCYPILHIRKLRLKDAIFINTELKKEEKGQSGDWQMTMYETVPEFKNILEI